MSQCHSENQRTSRPPPPVPPTVRARESPGWALISSTNTTKPSSSAHSNTQVQDIPTSSEENRPEFPQEDLSCLLWSSVTEWSTSHCLRLFSDWLRSWCWFPWAVSLWHKRAGRQQHLGPDLGLWVDQSGKVMVVIIDFLWWWWWWYLIPEEWRGIIMNMTELIRM